MPIRSPLFPAIVVGLVTSMTGPAIRQSVGTPAPAPAPPTRVEVVVDTLHGVAIPDPYRWLEDQASSETRGWIDAQNAHSAAMLDTLPQLPAIRQRLSEMQRIDRIGTSTHQRDERFFSWKKRAGDELWIFHVRQGPRGDDEVLLDPHTLSDDHTVDIDVLDIDRLGRRVAYGVRQGGEDELSIRILDVDTREHLDDALPRALYTGVAFCRSGDQDVLVYGRLDRALGSRIYLHPLGTGADPAGDEEIFGAGFPPDRWISPGVSEDGRFLLIHVFEGWSRTELHVQDLAAGGPIRPVARGLDAVFMAQGSGTGDRLHILTDWQAPNRRILTIDPRDPAPERWLEIVPECDDPLEEMTLAGDRLFAHYLHRVTSRIEMFDLAGHALGRVELPGLGRATAPMGRSTSPHVMYTYQSFTRPRTVYHLDLDTGESEVLARDAVPFDGDPYVERQVWFTSKDGTRVPMFVVHRRDLELTGDHPALLHGYGGFNVSMLPRFSSTDALWLELGGVYALASIRGGGEFGETWHRAGMLERKQNVFDDFIAAAEWLVANGYTRPSRLAISGGSNGGLLVGAALTQRPDLFQAVLCAYPDLDMLGYYRFPDNNKPALAEYGDASNPEHFPFLRAYSPYQRITDGTAYPAVLLTTGDADTRVPPLQARKMTARLQAATSSGRPVLLVYDTRAGHSGGQPLATRIEQSARELAFLCWQLGVESR